MPTFNKLFELLPNAEHLLSLEPEELAGPLLVCLVSLNDNQCMKPEEIISSSAMKRTMETISDSNRKDRNLNYPYKSYDKVLFALMEAWQWLEREGFVAQRPTSLLGSTTVPYTTEYFVTRRGLTVETSEDLESYRKVDLLPKARLHPIIAQKVWSLFLQGDYDTAVFQAFKQVEIAVRKAGGYEETDIGVSLMRKAFHGDTGNLTDPNQQPGEKESLTHLFAGAIGYCKNPPSHRNVDVKAEEAAEMIIFASYLLRLVDSRKQQTS